MKFDENISEEEAIELHLAAELSKQDPKFIFKAVGILGAQNIVYESFVEARKERDFSKKGHRIKGTPTGRIK